MFSLRIQSPWEEEEVKESESTSTGRTLMMSKSTASGTAPVEDVFKGLTVKDDGEEEEDRGPTKAVRFSSGNPRVEETRGVMHLYRNVRDNPATLDTLPVGRSPLVCVLAVPNYMTYADFCQFSGSFIQNILEMRIVRNDAFNDRYSVLMTFDNQNSADDFYRHYNRKPFSSMEAEICHVLFTADVQYTESIEHAATPPTGLTELPTCPVCLGEDRSCIIISMADARFDAQLQTTPPPDVLIELGHPLLNRVVDGFIKVGGVGALHAASHDAYKLLSQEETNSRSIEYMVQHVGKETVQWGLAAAVYSGLTYGLQEARGVHDWKNALVGGALAGAALSLTEPNPRHERVVQAAVTGGAIATAAEFLRKFYF